MNRIEHEMGAYAKGVLDAAASRGVITEGAKATLTAGIIKMYVDSKEGIIPFITEQEAHDQASMGQKAPGT